jgi:hypothetical protein
MITRPKEQAIPLGKVSTMAGRLRAWNFRQAVTRRGRGGFHYPHEAPLKIACRIA